MNKEKKRINFEFVALIIITVVLFGIMVVAMFLPSPEPEPQPTQPQIICICIHPATETSPPVIEPLAETTTAETTEAPAEELYFGLTKDEVNLLARITMAEAEGETDEGRRLVIDTVLNRIDSEHFPDNVYDVIYQPGQFSPVNSGRLDRCNVQNEYVQLVLEELENRTNTEVVFFQMYDYSPYGEDMFQVGCHYFSKWDEKRYD